MRSTSTLVAGLAAVAAAGLVAGCSSSGYGSAPAGSGGGGTKQAATGLMVAAKQVSGVGTVLTDTQGKTMYTPKQEASGTIKCTGSCLSFWFPVTMAKGSTPHAGSGVTGKLGTIQRPDGRGEQLTYNGKPLYTFRLDTGPGQAHGNDFSDKFGGQSFEWYAATASGTAPAPAPSSGGGGYSNGGGGGGY